MHVSGLTGEGLPELVETISAVAEVQELRAEQEGPVYGHILESNFHKGLGFASASISLVCYLSSSLIFTVLLRRFWCKEAPSKLGHKSLVVLVKGRYGA